jgi:hypothetical protein
MATIKWEKTKSLLSSNEAIKKISLAGAMFDDITEGSRFAKRFFGAGVIARNALKEGGNWKDAANEYFLRDASKGWEASNVRKSHLIGSGIGAVATTRVGMGAFRGATTDGNGNVDIAGIPIF